MHAVRVQTLYFREYKVIFKVSASSCSRTCHAVRVQTLGRGGGGGGGEGEGGGGGG